MATPAPATPPSSSIGSGRARPLETPWLGKLCPMLEAPEAAPEAGVLNAAGLGLGSQRGPAGRLVALGRPSLRMETPSSV